MGKKRHMRWWAAIINYGNLFAAGEEFKGSKKRVWIICIPNRMTVRSIMNKEKGNNEIEIVYLIVAHSNPDMLGRLINALDSKRAHFFIHIDKKTDISEFLPFIPIKQNVHLSENRIKVFWGGYSQVQATLNIMEEAINSGIDFKYAV